MFAFNPRHHHAWQNASAVAFLAFFLTPASALRASHLLGPVQDAAFAVGPGPGDVVFSDPTAKFLVLRLMASPGSTGDRVEVELGYGKDVFNLTPGQRFWTRPIGGSSATLRYLDNGNGLGGATVDRYGKGEVIDLFQISPHFNDPAFSTIGFCGSGPDWQNVACLDDTKAEESLMKTIAKSVGMFVHIGARSAADPTIVVGSCSAALIAPDLVLTAAHCVDGTEDVVSASFTLDFVTDCTDNRPSGYSPKFFKVTRRVRSGFEDPPAGDVDYAVLQLDTGIAGIGAPPLSIRPALDGPLAAHQEVFMIHHPRGVPKKVSRQPLDACEVNPSSTPDVISFGCDLDNGSSGSPLFDLTGEIVGVNDWAGGCSNGSQTALVIRPDMVLPVPPPVDINVMAVLDRSGSMSLPDLSGSSKIAKAKEAAELFYNLLREDHTYQAGLVSFSTTATPDRDPVLVSPASKGNLVAAVGLSASGMTTIGGGLKLARQKLVDAGGPNSPDLLLMTDGLHNTSPSIEEAEATLGPTRLCAVGFGTEASLDGPRLTRLARDHGGIYVRAGEGLDLKKFFALCFGNIFESGISMDPQEVLPAGVPASVPVPLQICGEQTLTVVAGWSDPAGRLLIELTTPGGAILTASTAGVTDGAGSTWAYLRLPLPFGGERDGTWKARVVRPNGGVEIPPPFAGERGGTWKTRMIRPRGDLEFQAPAPEERYFLTTVIQGGPRFLPADMPPLYTGDLLDPRVILRDRTGLRFPATVEVTVERPTEGTGNILTRRGLGPPQVIGGDAIDARAATLISLEQGRPGELVGRTTDTFQLFDDDEHGDRSLEPDGQFGNAVPDLTRFEGNYTFHARAVFGDGCTGSRETFWSAYVAVAVDPGQTTVTATPTGPLPGGEQGVTVTFTPKDEYGNFLGPGRSDSFDVGGLPGSDPVGGVRDLGNGSYEQDVAWDPASGEPPGVVVGQPGRPAVDLPAPAPPGFAGPGGRGIGLAFGASFPAGSASRRLDSGFAARLHYRHPLAPRFSLIGGLGFSDFGGVAPAGGLPLWDLTLGARWDSAPFPALRFFAEGGVGFYLADAPGNDQSFGFHLGVGIDVPLVPSKLDLEIGLQGHKLLGDDDNPDFVRALIGLEVHP